MHIWSNVIAYCERFDAKFYIQIDPDGLGVTAQTSGAPVMLYQAGCRCGRVSIL